jgi:hypothetical protein
MGNLIRMNVSEISTLAKAFIESGFFADSKSLAQAIVKIQAGQEMGIAPFAAMSGIHIISGKPTVGAGLMASMVKASGKYDYVVSEHSEKVCSIDFFKGSIPLGTSTFTLDDARKAGTKNLDKFPKNMLFARAMSNGVKWFTPDVFMSPVYVPEEMETVAEDPRIFKLQQSVKVSFESAANLDSLLDKAAKYMASYSDLIRHDTVWFNDLYNTHSARLKSKELEPSGRLNINGLTEEEIEIAISNEILGT